MTYVIYGAGAIGATIGGQLAAAGLPVSLIARGDHARAMAVRARVAHPGRGGDPPPTRLRAPR
ncbi:MAG: 2-dehydropantoate 2-reductase N-terminal domain-containing protein [Acidimicrobiales bacterium]